MNPMFARKMVLQLESLVQEKAWKLCKVVDNAVHEKLPCDLHHGFRAVSVDVISSFAFDKSLDLLDEKDLGARWQSLITAVGPAVWVFQLIPGLQELSSALPQPLVARFSKPLRAIFQLRDTFAKEIDRIKRRQERSVEIDRPTIFTTLLTAEKEEGQIPISDEALVDEAFSLMFAASDTTGNAMTVATFHVLRQPDIYARLKAELAARFPDASQSLPLEELETLPYLVCLPPSLRGFGVLTTCSLRLSRKP